MSERAPLPEALERPPRGDVLAFVPHADDDVIGLGGTLGMHAEAGDTVHVVVVFDGRLGDAEGRYDPVEYVERRRREARAAGAHLGLSSYEFWDYQEGHDAGPAEMVEAVEHLAQCLRTRAPRIVYAPWIGEQHLDHHVLSRGVRAALQQERFDGLALGFEVWTPLIATQIVDVTAWHERKRAALREHASQIEAIGGFEEKALALSRQRAMYLAPESRHGEAFAPLY